MMNEARRSWAENGDTFPKARVEIVRYKRIVAEVFEAKRAGNRETGFKAWSGGMGAGEIVGYKDA